MRGACQDMEKLQADVTAAGFTLAADGLRFQTKSE
jgi:hypothetical protein